MGTRDEAGFDLVEEGGQVYYCFGAHVGGAAEVGSEDVQALAEKDREKVVAEVGAGVELVAGGEGAVDVYYGGAVGVAGAEEGPVLEAVGVALVGYFGGAGGVEVAVDDCFEAQEAHEGRLRPGDGVFLGAIWGVAGPNCGTY